MRRPKSPIPDPLRRSAFPCVMWHPTTRHPSPRSASQMSNETSASFSMSWVSRIHCGTPSKGFKFSRLGTALNEDGVPSCGGWYGGAAVPGDVTRAFPGARGVFGASSGFLPANLSLVFTFCSCQADLGISNSFTVRPISIYFQTKDLCSVWSKNLNSKNEPSVPVASAMFKFEG